MIVDKVFVRKSWGWELWFDNTDLYCGKKIYIEYGKSSSYGSYHYHKKKTETFFILEGQLQLDYILDGNLSTVILKPNESFRIEPYTKHRFTSDLKYGCVFIEVSTNHREDDSYRCNWNGGKWIEVPSTQVGQSEKYIL